MHTPHPHSNDSNRSTEASAQNVQQSASRSGLNSAPEQAQERLRFFTSAARLLSEPLDDTAILRRLSRLCVPDLADWCGVDVLGESGKVEHIAIAHVDPQREILGRILRDRYPLVSQEPVGRVLQTGEPAFYYNVDLPRLAIHARDPEHMRLLQELNPQSTLILPLIARGRTVGALTLTRCDANRCYTPEDAEFCQDLAAIAAAAVDNARLYRVTKDAEVELRRVNQAKDEFVAILAHELRNPLAPVMSSLHIMQLTSADDTAWHRARDTAERQVRRMALLLDDLLDTSRISQGKIDLHFEAVDLLVSIDHAIQTAAPLIAERGHHIQVMAPGGPIEVPADPARLEQVFSNLVHNAAKYTNPGGRITVTLDRKDPWAVVTVSDNGIGISQDLQPRIFDSFTQGESSRHQAYGGLGLGLALVRRLLDLHQGRVEVKSDGEGHGSDFLVWLPLSRREALLPTRPLERPGSTFAPSETPLPSTPIELPPGPRRIAVIDDNPDGRETLCDIIELWGHDVAVAADGSSGLDLLRSFDPDVALIDIGLPGMSGYDVAREYRSSAGHERSFLVALTGYGQPEDRRKARESGFDAFFVKPVAPEVLAGLLSAVVPHRKSRP